MAIMYIITYSVLLQSLYSNSFSFFSNLIVVRAATSLHISLESLPTSSHNVSTSYPSPIRSAAFALRGPMNGPRRDQRLYAVSKKISMPTSPRPLIFFKALRMLVGEEPESETRLLRSPSVLESAVLQE
jgi:hypothetical protein